MAISSDSKRGMWSSRWLFVLAAAGSAVGLGNIWKFPYITGENGGGAFVIIYLVCVALVGIPIMMSEVLLGRCDSRCNVIFPAVEGFCWSWGRWSPWYSGGSTA